MNAHTNSSQLTPAEWEKSYQTYFDMVYRIAFTYLRNAADCEDAVQEVFLKRWHHKQPFNGDEHEKAWLITVTAHHCLDRLKRKDRTEINWDDVAYLPVRTRDEESLDLLNRVLQLPPQLIAPIYLYYYEGYATKEIAQLLKRNPSTVRNQLRDGRRKLKLELEEVDLQ
jgi:RNA polymerase sigma-70 factor (ECF subfamily)